jgi:trk system potassium uptake protein TrkH
MLLSAVIAGFNEYDSSFVPLLVSGVGTAIVGGLPLVFFRAQPNLTSKEGYFIVIPSWLMCCVFGMLPYLLWGGEFTPINALFESTSGYTTTGATILNDVEALPRGLLFFRSCTAWMGGLGVVVFMLLLLPTIKNMNRRLAKVEISSLSKDNFKYRLRQTVHIIISVYVGLTLAEFFLLWLAGMSPFDAINHAFSNVSTCGFSTRNTSIQAFDSTVIDTVIIVFMYLASLHFGLIFLAVSGQPKQLFRSPVVRFYTLALLCGILCMSVDLLINSVDYPDWWTAFHYAAFHVVSTTTTSGFAITDSSIFPVFSTLLLLYFSFQCACSGSTSSGIKADRMMILFQALKTQIRKMQHPNAVISTRMGNTTIGNDMISTVALFILLYIFTVFLVTLILALSGIGMFSSFSTAIAIVSNIGHGFGDVASSMGNAAGFSALIKFILSFTMLLGRLEIYGFIVIFSVKSWR